MRWLVVHMILWLFFLWFVFSRAGNKSVHEPGRPVFFEDRADEFITPAHALSPQVQTTTMCVSVSLSGSVVLGCLFSPKIHIILFQPQKNVATLRVTTNRFSATVSASASAPSSSYSKGANTHCTHCPLVCNRYVLNTSVTAVTGNVVCVRVCL